MVAMKMQLKGQRSMVLARLGAKLDICKVCSKASGIKNKLKSHIKIYQGAKLSTYKTYKLRCFHCLEPFGSKVDLTTHKPEQHKTNPSKKHQDGSKKMINPKKTRNPEAEPEMFQKDGRTRSRTRNGKAQNGKIRNV